MLVHNIAQHGNSPRSSPCILVPKADESLRFCFDFRKLNVVSKSDSFPLPRVDNCVDHVGAAKYVSKFDLLKGYYQVPLTELKSFVTPDGLYFSTFVSRFPPVTKCRSQVSKAYVSKAYAHRDTRPRKC